MKITFLANLLKGFDLFSTNVSLRYEDESSYETATGGLCSIALVIVFITVFMGTLTNTLNRIYIDSTTTTIQEANPSQIMLNTSTFMFALGISDVDLNEGDRWFDVYMQFRNYSSAGKNKTFIKLQKCEKSQWTSINETYGEFYDNRKLQQWLCPPSNLSMSLQGKYTSTNFHFYKIAVRQCYAKLDPTRPCAEDSVIERYLDSNEAFNFNFYFVNTIINPGNQDYISTFVDDFNYFPFSKSTGTNANFYISSYSVATDNSILPYEEMSYDTGGIVIDKAQLLNYEVRQKEYMKLNIRKASLVLDVSRIHRKIDDTISYIGGLFSAIISALLILGMYSELSFELNIAKSIYKNEKDEKDQAENWNIFTFFGFMTYCALSKIGINLPWNKMKNYDKSFEEIRKQMDIRLILHKIQFTERVANALLEKHQVKILHLQEYMTLDQSEKVREDFEFHDKLEKYYYEYIPNKNEEKTQKEKGTEPEIGTSTEKKFEMSIRSNKIVNESNSLVNSARESISSKVDITTPKADTMEDDSKLDFMKVIKHRLTQTSNKSVEPEEFKNMEQLTKELKICISILKKEEQEGNVVSGRILDSMDKRLLENVLEQHEDEIEELIMNHETQNDSTGLNLAHDILEFIPRIVSTPRRTFWQKKLQGRTVKSNSFQVSLPNSFKPNTLEFNQVSDLEFKNSYKLKSIKKIPEEDMSVSEKEKVKYKIKEESSSENSESKNDAIEDNEDDDKKNVGNEKKVKESFNVVPVSGTEEKLKASSLKTSKAKKNFPFGVIFKEVSDF